MSRPHKIKRSKGGYSTRPRPHPLTIILASLIAAGLLFVGASLYPLVYDFVMNGGSGTRDPEPASTPEQSQPAESSSIAQPEPEPEPEPEPVPQYAGELRAVYIPLKTVTDPAALSGFLDSLADTGVNSVMVDAKDRQGTVLYNTENASAIAWNARSDNAYDLAALSDELTGRGLELIVRMSTFRDEKAVYGNTELAVRYRGQDVLWLDNYANQGGKPWLNPYSSGARTYLTELALEISRHGAALILLEDFQFPPNSYPGDATFPESGGITRREALSSFARELTDTLSPHGTRLAIYFSASTLALEQPDILYGGSPAAIAPDEVVLGALPYQFTSGFSAGGLTLPNPLADIAATVSAVVQFGNAVLPDTTSFFPLIQGGNETSQGARYTAGQITAQISELEALDCREYILYCTDASQYLLK